jgi:hypothetical protein
MDFVADCRFDVKQAAARLECSMSQLVKLLKVEPTALERVNDQRRSLGQHPLR